MRVWAWAIGCGALLGTMAMAEEARIVWRAPGCHYPVLGWRMPVALAQSDWVVDRAVTGLADAAYNCHFYTRLHLVAQAQPGQLSRWLAAARHDGVDRSILRQAGLRPRAEGEPALVGDIVVAGRPDERAGMVFTHSAVVRAVDGQGRIRTLRQKFDAAHPVVDVDWTEFRMLYAGMVPYRTEIWTRSDSPQPQMVSR